jgi:uncharacterized lipoprotein YddW (UPF0748 family)
MLRWITMLLVLFSAALPAFAQSRTGEMRGAWMGSGYGRDWAATMKSLKKNGFNALFPNMCSGGAAFYPSKVLPQAAGGAPGRDEMAEAAKAAKQYGIELHVWRINWMLENAPSERLAELERQGRLMRNPEGKLVRDDPQDSLKIDWLCPSHPDNRKLEKEAMLELVRKYDIAGIQFDYMRYPSPNYCFCDHCRQQFQKDAGVTVEHWPADVTGDGQYAARYADWRRGLQTSLVAEISQEAHRIKPGVFVSLAAWPDREVAREWVLQDWPAWVAAGSLDFICFMDYTADDAQLTGWLSRGLASVRGSIPVYAGLGAFMLKDASALIHQIEVIRRAGADGFMAFAYYSGDLEKWLPQLRQTVTASDPNPMPHGGPPAVFGFTGPAMDRPAVEGQVLAGKELVVQMTLGTPVSSSREETSDEGAQVASVLQRSAGARAPVGSYEPAPPLRAELGEVPRVSGRMVAEDPEGATLANLGSFDADLGVRRSLRLRAPDGPFRLAVYGAVSELDGNRHDFVVRAPLLVGIEPPAVAESAPAMHTELNDMLSRVCARADLSQLAGLTAVLQLHYTGPGGGDWVMKIREGACQVSQGTVEGPDAVISTSAEDGLAMLNRQADPVALWNSGRVTVKGDLLLVQHVMAALGYSVDQ